MLLNDTKIQAEIRKCTAPKELIDGAAGRGMGSLRLRLRPGKRAVTATWLGIWKSNGQRSAKVLGNYPDLRLADARAKLAAEISTPLAAKQNPATVAPKVAKATVAALFEAYCDMLAAKKPGSDYNPRHVLLNGTKNAADALGRNRPAADVTPGDVTAHLHTYFAKGHRRQADITRSVIQAAYNFGIKQANSYTSNERRDWGLTINPAAMVERDEKASKPRERNLSAEEIAAAWHGFAGAGFTEDTADALRLLICCGQRVRETLRAEGKDFDLKAGVWTMPAHKTKGGVRPHTIPLPPQAVEIVGRLIARHGAGWLFPARGNAKGDVLTDQALSHGLRDWWKADKTRPQFQPRDLRRTWKSRTGELKIDRFTRDLIQQHASTDTGSKHYDRADYLPQMQEAMKKWGEWLAGVVATPPAPPAR